MKGCRAVKHDAWICGVGLLITTGGRVLGKYVPSLHLPAMLIMLAGIGLLLWYMICYRRKKAGRGQ